MPKGMIYLDCTAVSVVVCCRACGHWRAFRFTKLDGWRAAAAHEERTHPNLWQARDALAHAERVAGHAV